MSTLGESHLELMNLSERVEKLEKKARSFENRIGRLRGQITDLEVMEFQEQLNALDKRMNDINADLQGTARMAAAAIVRGELQWMLRYLIDKGKEIPALDAAATACGAQIREAFAAFNAQLLASQIPPLDATTEFENRVRPIMRQSGFDSYFPTPPG